MEIQVLSSLLKKNSLCTIFIFNVYEKKTEKQKIKRIKKAMKPVFEKGVVKKTIFLFVFLYTLWLECKSFDDAKHWFTLDGRIISLQGGHIARQKKWFMSNRVAYSKVVTVFIVPGLSIRPSFVCARVLRGRENHSPASNRHNSLITPFINSNNF